MKALTIASLSALALIGAACSESTGTDEVQTETAPAEMTEVAATEESGGFNLDLFDDGADDGFNISFEDDDSDTFGGFDFGDDREGRLLSEIPTIDAPMVPSDDEIVTLPDVPAVDQDDEIIRLPE